MQFSHLEDAGIAVSHYFNTSGGSTIAYGSSPTLNNSTKPAENSSSIRDGCDGIIKEEPEQGGLLEHGNANGQSGFYSQVGGQNSESVNTFGRATATTNDDDDKSNGQDGDNLRSVTFIINYSFPLRLRSMDLVSELIIKTFADYIGISAYISSY